MKNLGGFRWIVVAAVLTAMLASAVSFRADAQSEYMRGDRMPYDAFDRMPKTDIEIGGGTIHVGFAPGEMTLPREKVLDWVRMSAKAVATYYGRFPVEQLRLLLVPVDGARIRGGTTWGYRGAAIRIPLGRNSTEEVLRRDWVMVHEMVHTALPDLNHRYTWLSEGLAVYVEPVARVQAGDLTAAEIWQAMMRDMPKGLPQAGDQGLDNTDTWGRKYWGGAMFCLLADIEIRKRTDNRLGLQDAMRGVLAAGGNHEKGLVDRSHPLHRRQGRRRRRADEASRRDGPKAGDAGSRWPLARPRPEAAGREPRIRRHRAAGRDPQGHHRAAREIAGRLSFGSYSSPSDGCSLSTSWLIDLDWMARNSVRAVVV